MHEAASPGLPPAFVLNLERRPERRAAMTAQLTRHGIDVTFVDAIDASREDMSAAHWPFDCDAANGKNARPMEPAEIACAIGHRRLYEHVVGGGHEVALLLEDDAVLAPDATAVIAAAIKQRRHWDLCLLGHSGAIHDCNRRRGATASVWGRRKLVPGREMAPFVEVAWGAYAYLVTAEGARLLLAEASPVTTFADRLTGDAPVHGIRQRGVVPPVADVGDHPSDIVESRREAVFGFWAQWRATQGWLRRRLLGRRFWAVRRRVQVVRRYLPAWHWVRLRWTY